MPDMQYIFGANHHVENIIQGGFSLEVSIDH